MGSVSAPGTDSDPAVAATVRLLHRRRGWAWATVLSVVAWIVACGLLGSLDPNATGVWLAVSSILILLLTAVAVVSLVAAVADTVKLRRRDPGVRKQAVRHTAHYPARAHSYSYPPRHRFTWVFSWLVMLILVGIGVAALPGLVDGVAYAAGAESTSVFMPTSYGQDCGRSGCTTITNGVLANGAAVTWPNQVPLGQAFTVHEPLWNWGFGSQLIDGDGTAAGYIFGGVLFDGFAVLVLVHLFKLARRWLRHRQLGQQMAGASWASGRLPWRSRLDPSADLGQSRLAALDAPPALNPPGRPGRRPGGGVGRLELDELAG
jgi:hypothetical protein